jgi:hypothetical protein
MLALGLNRLFPCQPARLPTCLPAWRSNIRLYHSLPPCPSPPHSSPYAVISCVPLCNCCAADCV